MSGSERIEFNLPRTFDARRVGAAYVQLRKALALANAASDTTEGRFQALNATIGFLLDGFPETAGGDTLAVLKGVRDDLLRDVVSAQTRDGGRAPVPADVTRVRCHAIACVRFLQRTGMTKTKARVVVADTLRGTDYRAGGQALKNWETKWMPGQHIPAHSVLAAASPESDVNEIEAALVGNWSGGLDPVTIVRNVMHATVEAAKKNAQKPE